MKGRSKPSMLSENKRIAVRNDCVCDRCLSQAAHSANRGSLSRIVELLAHAAAREVVERTFPKLPPGK
jgi:hypothetical protein